MGQWSATVRGSVSTAPATTAMAVSNGPMPGQYVLRYTVQKAGTFGLSVTVNGLEIATRLRTLAFQVAGMPSAMVANFGGLNNVVVRPYFSAASRTSVVRVADDLAAPIRVGDTLEFNIAAEVRQRWCRLNTSA